MMKVIIIGACLLMAIFVWCSPGFFWGILGGTGLVWGFVVGVRKMVWDGRVLQRQESQHVVIVGAGAAGMACAFSLSRWPEYRVTVVDEKPVCGGVATSERWRRRGNTNQKKNGGEEEEEEEEEVWFNDGVQGGAIDTYTNVLRLHRLFGFEPKRVPLNVAFGSGKWRWTNYGPVIGATQALQEEIQAFSRLMERVYAWGNIFMLIDICQLLRWLQYSPEFIDHYVLALTALFFGTGNQTRAVPAAVVARVFCDPEFAIFRLDPARFIGKSADFFAFQDLGRIYATMQEQLSSTGRVSFRLGCGVQSLHRHQDKQGGHGNNSGGCVLTLRDGQKLRADRVVFACDAQTALEVLGSEATLMERWTLGGVRFFRDVTYTHTDQAYMRQQFGWEGSDSDCMYIIRPYQHDPSRGEMGFVLSNYQAHLSQQTQQEQEDQAQKDGPLFQTIYLDQEHDQAHWTLPHLDKSRVVLVKWWRQFAHSRQHFLRVVPFVRFLQRPHQQATLFCGSWTMVNTHEAATISGFAAAYRLGAPYPFEAHGFSYRQFLLYLQMIHGLAV